MTAKLIVLYKKPADTKAFDDHYFNIHVPLAEKMPGLIKSSYSRITGSPMGQPGFYLMAELTFDSQEALQQALASPEGRAAGKDVMGFAGDLVHMMFADVVDTPAGISG